MQEYLETIQKWYSKYEGEILYDTRLLYLIELFQLLKKDGLQKQDLILIGEKILPLLHKDLIDESIYMVYQRRVAEEIHYAFRIVNKEFKEIKDEPIHVEPFKVDEDMVVYANNEGEDEIDPKDIEYEDIQYDLDFIKTLNIKNLV